MRKNCAAWPKAFKTYQWRVRWDIHIHDSWGHHFRAPGKKDDFGSSDNLHFHEASTIILGQKSWTKNQSVYSKGSKKKNNLTHWNLDPTKLPNQDVILDSWKKLPQDESGVVSWILMSQTWRVRMKQAWRFVQCLFLPTNFELVQIHQKAGFWICLKDHQYSSYWISWNENHNLEYMFQGWSTPYIGDKFIPPLQGESL